MEEGEKASCLQYIAPLGIVQQAYVMALCLLQVHLCIGWSVYCVTLNFIITPGKLMYLGVYSNWLPVCLSAHPSIYPSLHRPGHGGLGFHMDCIRLQLLTEHGISKLELLAIS